MARVGTWFAALGGMDTTSDFVHLNRIEAPGRARSPIIHTRIVTAAVLTGIYLAIAVVTVAVLGPLVLPMFLVPLPLALVLLWESVDVLRADEGGAY